MSWGEKHRELGKIYPLFSFLNEQNYMARMYKGRFKIDQEKDDYSREIVLDIDSTISPGRLKKIAKVSDCWHGNCIYYRLEKYKI